LVVQRITTVFWKERLTTLTVPAIEFCPSWNADSRQMRCWLIRLWKEEEAAEGWVNIGTKEVDDDRVAGTGAGFAAIFLIGIGALTWYSLGSRSRSVKAEIGTLGISSVNTLIIFSSNPRMSANLTLLPGACLLLEDLRLLVFLNLVGDLSACLDGDEEAIETLPDSRRGFGRCGEEDSEG